MVCSICLGKMGGTIDLVCGHTFHYKCIYNWGSINEFNTVCPLCRTVIHPRLFKFIEALLEVEQQEETAHTPRILHNNYDLSIERRFNVAVNKLMMMSLLNI